MQTDRSTRPSTAFLTILLLLYSWLFPWTSTLAQESRSSNTTFTPTSKPVIALALGGGGTRGVAHIGVLRVLEREKIPFTIITGTSIGAIIGGLYSAGIPLDEIEKHFTSKRLLKSYLTVPIEVRIALVPLFSLAYLFWRKPLAGMYKGERFRKYINKAVGKDEILIENLKYKFAAITCNLSNGQAYAITNGNLGQAIQASCAIPILRRPVELSCDKILVDGGIVENIPVNTAKELGADLVIAVNIDDKFHFLPEKNFRKVVRLSNRVINVILSQIDKAQTVNANIVIHPDVGNISLLSTNVEEAKNAILLGEDAATKALPQIRELLAKHQSPIAP